MQRDFSWTYYEHDNPAPWVKDIKPWLKKTSGFFGCFTSFPFHFLMLSDLTNPSTAWHKFGDDIQGTVSNTNMSNPVKEARVWEATVAYISINTTIYRHITTPISMKPRWTLKRKLIVRFRHQCTLAYHGDQGPCRWNHRGIYFFWGFLFQGWSNHVGRVTNDKKLDNKSEK